MVTVTASLKTGKIISVVDHGPKSGDNAYLDVIADIIAERIVREGLK